MSLVKHEQFIVDHTADQVSQATLGTRDSDGNAARILMNMGIRYTCFCLVDKLRIVLALTKVAAESFIRKQNGV